MNGMYLGDGSSEDLALDADFFDPIFNSTSNATSRYEWELDVTTAKFDGKQVGVLITTGVLAGTGAVAADNGPEGYRFDTVSAVPEPSAFAFFTLVGGVSLGLKRRRRSEV